MHFNLIEVYIKNIKKFSLKILYFSFPQLLVTSVGKNKQKFET